MTILPWIQRPSERRWLLYLAVVALAARLVWTGLMIQREPRFDEVEYLRHATELSRGQGYVDPAGNRDAFWPVGYPFILSMVYRVTGPSRIAAVGLQISLGTLTCLLLYVLGKQTFGILVARVASLLLAVYPNQVFFSTLYVTEPLFTLLLLGAFAFLLRSIKKRNWMYPVTAGVLLGLAALTRPPILLFPCVLPFWFVRNGWRWPAAGLTALVVLGSTLATVSPWLVRNHELSGRWTDISTSGGMVFWAGNNPQSLGGYANSKQTNAPLWDGDHYDWPRGYRLGWEAIRAAPAQAVMRCVFKITYFFALETDGALWNLKGFERAASRGWTLVLLLLANAAYLFMLSTGLLGLLSPPFSSPIKTFFLLLAGFLLFVTIIFQGDPRYHYPLVPLMLLFSCKGMLNDLRPLVAQLRQGNVLAKRRAAMWAITMSLFALMMTGNLWLKYLESKRF